jgi:hypothetical protein
MSTTEIDIQTQEAKRAKWRLIGIICGVASLLSPFIAFTSLPMYASGNSFAAFLFLFAIFGFIPLMVMGFVGMAIAISARNTAARLRELSKFQ